MNIVFMGTPEFALPALEALLSSEHSVKAVYTRPDAVSRRGNKTHPSPVKQKALESGIPVHTPGTFSPSSDEGQEAFRELVAYGPTVICVVAYGMILPDEVLALPRYGCINIHGSLLPRWRGAAPIQRALLAGDAEIGISIMQLVIEMDAGDYCRQEAVSSGELSLDELNHALATRGASALVQSLDEIEAGTVVWTEQDLSKVTYAEKIGKRELFLDPESAVIENLRRIRTSSDSAAAKLSLLFEDGDVASSTSGSKPRSLGATIVRAKAGESLLESGDVLESGVSPLESGDALVLREGKKRQLFLGMADGAIEVLSLKPDGKKEMDVSSWLAGLQVLPIRWSVLDGQV